MANLSPDEQNIIREHLLSGALDHLRDGLQTTEDSYESDPKPRDDQGPKRQLQTADSHNAL